MCAQDDKGGPTGKNELRRRRSMQRNSSNQMKPLDSVAMHMAEPAEIEDSNENEAKARRDVHARLASKAVTQSASIWQQISIAQHRLCNDVADEIRENGAEALHCCIDTKCLWHHQLRSQDCEQGSGVSSSSGRSAWPMAVCQTSNLCISQIDNRACAHTGHGAAAALA